MNKNKNLFDLAMGWYKSGDSGKKAAALDLFPREMFEKEEEAFKKRDKEEKKKAREQELKDVLAECKKLFPVGTPVWSDDGTDNCVNIVVEEPHIAVSEYRVPWGKYDFDEKERKTVVAKVVRLEYFGNDVIDGKWGISIIGLEKCLEDMKSTKEITYGHKNHIIDLEELWKKKSAERNKEIKELKENILNCQAELDKYKADLAELEAWNPYDLTKEKIQEIVKNYAK